MRRRRGEGGRDGADPVRSAASRVDLRERQGGSNAMQGTLNRVQSHQTVFGAPER